MLIFAFSCRLFSQNNRPIFECINISTNELSNIPSNIMTLKLINSKINDDDINEIINTNIDIVSLIINYCNITKISINPSRGLINLKNLDLSHNSLSKFPIGFLSAKRLQRLILSHNKFISIPINLSSFRDLNHLDLSYNEINYIENESLKSNSLEFIDLSYNKLEYVQRSDFGTQVNFVELDGNPWKCDCHLRDFVKFQKETLISKSLQCYTPLSLRGLSWSYLLLEVCFFAVFDMLFSPCCLWLNSSKNQFFMENFCWKHIKYEKTKF